LPTGPDRAPVKLPDGTWLAGGVRGGVHIEVVVPRDGAVRSGWPSGGTGVTRDARPVANTQPNFTVC
jgi:hypothetical protein